MKLIQKISEKIEDEIEDAKCYAKLANEVKVENPSLAEVFFAISKQESDHLNRLHDQVTILIQDYKNKNGEAPESMIALYDYLHKKHIEDFADAKRYQDIYQGK